MVWHTLITFDVRLQIKIVAEEILLSNMASIDNSPNNFKVLPTVAPSPSNYRLSI